MNRLIKILIMCRKRITFIICIFSLSPILNDTLAESPNYKINNRGRRLDHILASKEIENLLVDSKILDKYRNKEKPSDHVPVCLELKN